MFLVTRRPGEAFVITDKDTGEEIIVTERENAGTPTLLERSAAPR